MKFTTLLFLLTLSFTGVAQTNQLFVDYIPTAENDEAIRGFATNDGLTRTVGVHGKSDGIDGQGVWGQGTTGVFALGNAFGVYAVGPTAGYFSGDLTYTGNLSQVVPPFKYKKHESEEPSYLNLINGLKIKSFTYKHYENPVLNLATGKQYEVLTQDLEKLFPSLVRQSKKPVTYSADGEKITEEVASKSVNYIGLIPITVASVQELSKQVKDQQTEIKELKGQIESLAAAVELLKKN